MFKKIWDSRSALSKELDIYSLTFVRWNRREEFSPWNCILLTLQEATAHLKLDDAEGVSIACHFFGGILLVFSLITELQRTIPQEDPLQTCRFTQPFPQIS